MKKVLLFVVVVLFAGCSSNNPIDNSIKISSESISVLSGAKISLKATSLEKITYSSGNNYYATVSDSGLVTGGRIGTVNITLKNNSDTKTVKVTTYTTNFLYPDPILDFGVSKSSIISKLGTPAYQATSGNLSGIRYDNSTSTTAGTVYYFTDDKLNLIQVRVKTAYTTLLTSYLTDRFAYAGQSSGSFIFFNEIDSKKITVGVSNTLFNTDYWQVAYVAYTPSSSVRANSPRLKMFE